MDFSLSDAAVAVREGVGAIGAKYGHDYWSSCEDEHRFPWELWRDLADGGWVGLTVPEEYGGGGQGMVELAVACETLAASGAGSAAVFPFIPTPGFGATTLVRHGTAEQRRAILPGVADGSVQFSLGLTEPDAGSDALAITTRARPDGDDFLLRGQKTWISGVDNAAWMIVVARTTPAAEAVRRTAGLTLFLDDIRVPANQVLGRVDEGFALLWDVLNPERILAAAGGVGTADAALAVATDYARTRTVFGRPIGANQGLQFPLAQIKARTELGRLMTQKAAWLFDHGLPCGNEANIAKLTGAQVAWEAADQAFQTFGGMAYALEAPVARLFRDARIGRNIPVAEELVLAHIATQVLDLPRSY
jgi:acyl-CoA dehydrogenase